MGEVAVLNFANSVNLGGGGKYGAVDRLATIQKLMAKLFDKALRRLDSEFNEIEFAVFGSKINFERFHKVMIRRNIDD